MTIDVWRGSFLNASGSWAGRGGNLLGGRGELLWEAPEGAEVFWVWFGAVDD